MKLEQHELRKMQKIQKEMLDEVVNICNKYSLEYYLIGGTLLGAVRHKGFIPWDDDIDIGMPRKDYEKLIEICIKELSPLYYLQCCKTDKNYWFQFAKIKKNCTVFEEKNLEFIETHKGIFIDIFPLDDSKSIQKNKKTFYGDIIKKMFNIIVLKRGFNFKKSKKEKIIIWILKPISLSICNLFVSELMKLKNNKNLECYVNYGSPYSIEKETIHKSKYTPAVKVEFEGSFYNAPRDYDYILKKIYGNYMELPPLEKRVSHNPIRIEFGDEI